MNILQLTGYFFPEKAASIYLDENLLEAFGTEGFNTLVYTPTPCRGLSKEERTEYQKRKNEFLFDGTLEIRRFSMYSEGKNPILRALRYVLCWMKQYYYGVKAKDIDCIYSTHPRVVGCIP